MTESTFPFKKCCGAALCDSQKPLPHTSHTDDGKKTTERPSVCGQPLQKSTIGEAHVILHCDDSRLSKHQSLRFLHVYRLLVQCSILFAQFRRKEYARTKVGYDILSWVRCKSAESTQKIELTLGTDLSVDSRATSVFLCAFSALTRSSVTAADGSTRH